MPSDLLPYGNVADDLLTGVINGLKVCVEYKNKLDQLDATNEKLLACFSPFEKRFTPGKDKHISWGLPLTHRIRLKTYPRLAKLTVQAYKEAQIIAKAKHFQGFVIPSPLYILFKVLTVPKESHSSAYSLATCRAILFKVFKVHPKHPDIESGYFDLEQFEIQEVQNALSSFKRNIDIQARWPKDTYKNTYTTKINFLVGHFLAMRGVAHLWFKENRHMAKFLDRKLTIGERYTSTMYHFRSAWSYAKLPSSSELINLLAGIPLPIRGAETVFFGGLKKAHNSSLVISISGKAGAGKTSAALALAATLSPFGTQSLYLTLEEGEEDLKNRLVSLIPDYLRELSIFQPVFTNSKDKEDNWFDVVEVKEPYTVSSFQQILVRLKENLEAKRKPSLTKQYHGLPAVCPSLIVIDNISELVHRASEGEKENIYGEIEKFIISCRKLKTIIILISAAEIPKKINLDYLVDIAIVLKQEGSDKIEEKPYRVFQLTKTRHQMSRSGTHILHLSGSSGFRISPQIPSQIDKRKEMKSIGPLTDSIIHTLNVHHNDGNDDNDSINVKMYDFLKIFTGSKILVHGYGSGGKAGFGLKLLLTPPVASTYDLTSLKRINYSNWQYRRKILIISFLYSEEYYKVLHSEKIKKINDEIYKGLQTPIIECISFYPGFLTPEDMVSKITRNIDKSILEGEPYTGILLDGLHNVFLQFRKIQERDMVWPLLYSILSRYEITVVTTFTTFALQEPMMAEEENNSFPPRNNARDQELLQKGQLPFLHALVQATDFYFRLEHSTQLNEIERKYLISVMGAIKLAIPVGRLEWDRENLLIKGIA